MLSYLRTAVVNGARSVYRSRGRARLLRVPHDPPVWSAEAAPIDGEDRRALLAAIVRLPRRQREVLVSTVYLINPATRTRATLQLHGVPNLRSTMPSQFMGVGLAW